MSNDVNATGIVGTIGLPAASTKLPSKHIRAAGVALVEDDDAGCPCGLSIEDLLSEEARPALDQSDPNPRTKPLKSAMVQPLDELGSGVAGMMMPPAGRRGAVVVPVLCPGFHSSVSVKS